MQQSVILVIELKAWPWYVQYEPWLRTTHAAFRHTAAAIEAASSLASHEAVALCVCFYSSALTGKF